MKDFYNSNGYLELILGPMKSGKTSKLIEIYKQYKYCNVSICVINHILDKRYSDCEVVSHDGIKIPCVSTHCLMDLLNKDNEQKGNNNNNNNILECDVFLINEGQFFKDLYECVLDLLNNHKKTIYISGLDGDYKKEKIGTMLDLIPHSDNVIKLNSLCGICRNGSKAIFSKRISNEIEQIVVGVDNYIPVCRKCYDC